MSEIEDAVLRWYRARLAFCSAATVIDATTKLPFLKNPNLFTNLGAAEAALAQVANSITAAAGSAPSRSPP